MATADEISALCLAADAGRLDALECPKCQKPAVSVSFAHPGADEYRVWFACSECSFSMTGRHLGKPRHFSEDRVNAKLQAYDVELFRKVKAFPRA
jgi:hypothetical protein